MARPLRPAPAPSAPHASSSTAATPKTSSSTPRTSARPRRPSTSVSTAPSTPYTPGPSTPLDFASRQPRPSTVVEAKAHGLRSVGGASEKTPCPFPGTWGGRDKCGILEEDEADEVLMGVLSAIASLDNRALSAEEIASTCFQQGWLRPPSAAIEPTTQINNAIRAYLKRCERTARHCLLHKYQLAGSVIESALESALHPEAFNSAIRPKGTVWFLLSAAGKSAKWKSPFDGLELPKVPPRKPAAPSTKKQQKSDKENKPKAEERRSTSSSSKGKGKPAAPVKIRLVLNGATGGDDESASDVASSSRSRSRSVGPEPMPIAQSAPQSLKRTKPRRVRDILDSSSDSDTSDSDMEFDGPIQPRLLKPSRPLRKNPPTPLPLGGSPRVSSLSRIPQHSPFMDLFISPVLPSMPAFAPPHSSPFPSHSLDNTTWTARHDRLNQFETSSSSSDDDLRDLDWGISSDIMMKSPEGDEEIPPWSVDDDEAKVKEATDALRVLFPMSSIDDERDLDNKFELNRLDNHSAASEMSSSADNSSATTTRPPFGQLRALDAGVIPLNTFLANSSPVASPNLKFQKNLLPAADVSPTQHLSKLRGSFDPTEMEVDDESLWLDESGELPVKAEDTLSDIELNSTIGDAPTPEHDRHLDTALWAQEASAIRIKQEPEDYPSPATTDPDDQSATGYLASRASSTPSSGSSELPPFEIDVDHGRMNLDEVIVGPESVSVEELDGWMPTQGKTERTPHRGRPAKSRHHPSRCSGNWGGIGVCNSLANIVKPLARTRSTKSNATARRRRSSPCTPLVPQRLVTPETEEEEIDDAIGTADLERARVEAEAKEEQHRSACKAKAEQQRALFEAYRQTIRAENPESAPQQTPWSESSTPWGSNDSFNLVSPSSLSPMALHSDSALHMHMQMQMQMQMQMMAVDPKALVSPPLQRGFGVQLAPPIAEISRPSSAGMLDVPMTTSQEPAGSVPTPMPMTSGAGPISPAVPAPRLQPAQPAKAASISPKGKSKNRPISPAIAAPSPAPSVYAASQATSAPVPVRPTPISVPSSGPNEKPTTTAVVALPTTLPVEITPPTPTPTPTTKPATAPAPATAGTAGPAEVPRSTPSPAQSSAAQGTAPAPPGPTAPTTSTSATSSTVSTPTSATSATNGNGNGNRSGGKIATITKPLCPGVDACVVDNIPVYAHIFDGRNGGKQVLLRRLDTDFVNANALLHALCVPEPKHAEYLDNPISPLRLAARHTIPLSDACTKYSPGVSGIWVHLSEAREFARRAKLTEGSLLSSVLREDLFQLFATLAGIKPDHPTSDTFGLAFVPRTTNPAPGASTGASSTLSTNSKSTPNLSALSASVPSRPSPSPGIASASVSGSTTPSPTSSAPAQGQAKGPLVRTAPATPEGCPQSKRRRNTVSHAVPTAAPTAAVTGAAATATATATATANTTGTPSAAKKVQPQPQPHSQPHLHPQTQAATQGAHPKPQQHPPRPLTKSHPIAPAPGPSPAASTRLSVAAAKRATRASIGGTGNGTAGLGRPGMAK